MKNLFKILIGLTFIATLGCKSNLSKSENIDSSHIVEVNKKSEDFNAITIDSQRVSEGTIDYRLLYNVNGKKLEIYRLTNQDYSIEFKRKYIYMPLGYVCYEVSDLPTGLTWDVLFESKSNSFFITEQYDIHAVGDTLDRTTVDFSKKTAIVVSGDKGNRYNIKLNKLWPK